MIMQRNQQPTTLWQILSEIRPISPGEQRIAKKLFRELQQYGFIRKSCLEMLQLSDEVIIKLYALLSQSKSTNSPVRNFADSRWMASSDFCFINIRATGLGQDPGTLIHASKLLPSLRVSAIHLGPFTSYAFGTIYAVQSVESISAKVIDNRLVESGFSADDQLRALVQAAHLLGKTVGYDLEPHTAQFSFPVVMNPEVFRWIKLADSKDELDGSLANEEMLAEGNQERIIAQVRQIVDRELESRGIGDLETRPVDDPALIKHKDETFTRIVKALIEAGYWPLPSQAWSGVGLPAFTGYDHRLNCPKFAYLNEEGQDQGAYAYNVLTPYKFYSGIKPNRPPDDEPRPFEPGVTYFGKVFTRWRDNFGFDFVRHDSADHIFDSLWAQDSEAPASDRPSPYVLEQAIKTSKSEEKPYVGNFAERMGNEIEAYAGLGFDLMLGTDMLERVDKAMIEKSFRLYDRLAEHNRQSSQRFSVAFCVDTHDTGNPHMWGESLVKVMGFERMRLRHFVSRFISAGYARRPKYEVMGSQDLSYGLYVSNISDKNLIWTGNKGYNRRYHLLEDVYDRYKGFIAEAEIRKRVIEPNYAWWVIQHEGQILVPLISLESDSDPGEALRHIEIDLQEIRPDKGISNLVVYDFETSEGKKIILTGQILRVDLPDLGFRLLSNF
ncbi:MAG: hypothetical protein P8Y14_11555 [Anaerolineales bacterium]|jgi:hypothetical protein